VSNLKQRDNSEDIGVDVRKI